MENFVIRESIIAFYAPNFPLIQIYV